MRRPETSTDLRGLPVREWPEDYRRDWLERASIIEFEGNVTRDEAEALARSRVIRAWKAEKGIE